MKISIEARPADIEAALNWASGLIGAAVDKKVAALQRQEAANPLLALHQRETFAFEHALARARRYRKSTGRLPKGEEFFRLYSFLVKLIHCRHVREHGRYGVAFADPKRHETGRQPPTPIIGLGPREAAVFIHSAGEMRIHGGRASHEAQRRQRLKIGRVLVQTNIVGVTHVSSRCADIGMVFSTSGREPIERPLSIAPATAESVG
ncbi:hypothetical protein ACVWXO_009884 [Bradyrhizobium sp. LM2.7]